MLIFVIAVVALAVVGVLLEMRAENQPNHEKFSVTEAWTAIQRQGGRAHERGLAITRKGVDYQFDYIHRDEASDYIRVSRDIQASQLPGSLPELPTMQLRRETGLDRFGKFILLNKEVQTFDEDFDDDVYIECDARGNTAARMLQSAGVRGEVNRLLAMGFQLIEFRQHGHALVASWRLRSGRFSDFDEHIIEASIASLERIASGLPPVHAVPTKTQRSPGFWLLRVLGLLCVLATGAYLYVLDLWPPLGSGLQPVSLLGATLLFLALFVFNVGLVRGTSNALRSLVLSTVISGCLAWVIGFGVMVGINGSSEPLLTTHERTLQHKRIKEGRESDSYYFYFPDIPGVEDAPVPMVVGKVTYHQGQEGDSYAITVGEGRLGTPWLKELKKL